MRAGWKLEAPGEVDEDNPGLLAPPGPAGLSSGCCESRILPLVHETQ